MQSNRAELLTSNTARPETTFNELGINPTSVKEFTEGHLSNKKSSNEPTRAGQSSRADLLERQKRALGLIPSLTNTLLDTTGTIVDTLTDLLDLSGDSNTNTSSSVGLLDPVNSLVSSISVTGQNLSSALSSAVSSVVATTTNSDYLYSSYFSSSYYQDWYDYYSSIYSNYDYDSWSSWNSWSSTQMYYATQLGSRKDEWFEKMSTFQTIFKDTPV